MSFRSVSTGEPGRLALFGSLTIDNAAGIREELLRAFRESDRITLEIGQDAVADLSFLQIICSAYRKARREKKKFDVDWSSSPGISQALSDAGYSPDEPCFSSAGGDMPADRGAADG